MKKTSQQANQATQIAPVPFKLLSFATPASKAGRNVLDELAEGFKTLERLAGPEFLRRNYLEELVDKDIACFRRHRTEQWDQDANSWVPRIGGAR